MRIEALMFILCGLPASAGAADLSIHDPACIQVATVQYLDCEVAQVFTCPAVDGLAAPLVREEVYKGAGLDHYSVSTRNGAPLLTSDVAGKVVIRADIGSLHETTLEDVQATGVGLFTSTGMFRLLGMEKAVGMTVSLVVTGEERRISGLRGLVVSGKVALVVPPPMGAVDSIEQAFLMPDLGIYVTGETTGGMLYKPEKTPHRPLSIALPDQSGFATDVPASCGSLSLETPLNVLNGVPT